MKMKSKNEVHKFHDNETPPQSVKSTKKLTTRIQVFSQKRVKFNLPNKTKDEVNNNMWAPKTVEFGNIENSTTSDTWVGRSNNNPPKEVFFDAIPTRLTTGIL